MSVLDNPKGVSLVELLLAVVLVTVVMATLSTTMPKISQNIVRNNQRWTAAHLASAQIENLKVQPYAFVGTTASGLFNAANTLCDCKTDDFSAMPSTGNVTAGTTFNVAACVNAVSPAAGNTWTPQCTGDTGYKTIVVRVFWTSGSTLLSTTQEGLKTRL